MRVVLITVLAITLLGSAAWAGDPVGTYSVSGSNPGGGGAYSGTATVEKTGATYKVTWRVRTSRAPPSAIRGFSV